MFMAWIFPGETFRVLKEKEEKEYGEYRTRRLILEALENIESIHKATGVRCGTCGGGILPTPEMDVFHP
jgi:DNA-directed RNA polymerase subunit RPC12/RpoP